MQEINANEEVWDKKKIFIVLLVTSILIVLAGYATKKIILSKDANSVSLKFTNNQPKSQVEGASTKEEPNPIDNSGIKSVLSLPANEVQKRLDFIRQEISKIDVVEIASSSPQVQKVIKDIQSLEQYPRDQAKEICQKMCSSL